MAEEILLPPEEETEFSGDTAPGADPRKEKYEYTHSYALDDREKLRCAAVFAIGTIPFECRWKCVKCGRTTRAAGECRTKEQIFHRMSPEQTRDEAVWKLANLLPQLNCQQTPDLLIGEIQKSQLPVPGHCAACGTVQPWGSEAWQASRSDKSLSRARAMKTAFYAVSPLLIAGVFFALYQSASTRALCAPVTVVLLLLFIIGCAKISDFTRKRENSFQATACAGISPECLPVFRKTGEPAAVITRIDVTGRGPCRPYEPRGDSAKPCC